MPVGQRSKTIRQHSQARRDAEERWSWDLIAALLGGTKRMRDEASKWLPREAREEPASWRARVSRSTLYAAFEDTIEALADKPFSQPTTVQGGKLPEGLTEFWDDMDSLGGDGHHVLREHFVSALTWGWSVGLVDYPQGPSETAADDASRRPYVVLVEAPDVLGWTTTFSQDHGERLTSIRFLEGKQDVAETDSPSRGLERVRVYTDNEWQVWQEDSRRRGEFVLIEEGQHTFGRVPAEVLYFGRRVDSLRATPPMLKLAWLNLAHFQSDSDQSNILKYVRVPLLHITGVTSKEKKDEIVIGPDRIIKSSDPQAKMGWVEHNGAAIEAGERHLKVLEERMEVMGLKPLMERGQGKTASGRILDAQSADDGAKSWVRRTERFGIELLKLAAEWKKVELHPEVRVDIFSDFEVVARGPEEVKILQADRQRGDLDIETYLGELKRRGLLRPSADVEDIAAKAQAEASRELEAMAEIAPPPAAPASPGSGRGGAAFPRAV